MPEGMILAACNFLVLLGVLAWQVWQTQRLGRELDNALRDMRHDLWAEYPTVLARLEARVSALETDVVYQPPPRPSWVLKRGEPETPPGGEGRS